MISNITNILIFIAGFVYSIILHEIAHGFVAYLSGDDTAKKMGRLSLNPIPHIDPVGSIVIPGMCFLFSLLAGSSFIVGWARPVPINPFQFRKRRMGEIFVSLAGVTVNFVIMIIMIVLFAWTQMKVFVELALTNFFLLYLNMLPIPPLDGYNFFINILPEAVSFPVKRFIAGRERVFLGILFLIFASPAGQFIFRPVFPVFEFLATIVFSILGLKG